VAGGGDGEASEASEWEHREREEQLAFLGEEEEWLVAGGLGFSRSPVVFCGLSFVFHFPYIFWRSASERLHLDGSWATHPYFFNFIILYSAVLGRDSLSTHSLS